MPKKPDGMLRIYCLCGQRMRVSEAMYGKPGKCVACRQKIRIPSEHEIPDDTKVIHLKDHPEFLRKKTAPGEPEPIVEMSPPADFDFEVPSTIALDILEPVQTLTSLSLKFNRRLNALEDSPKTETQRAALVAAQKRVQVARTLLNDRLAERLEETTAELGSISTKITQRTDMAQAGDITMFEYRDTIDMLRRQREHLERLQHNLRGWIAARNPDMAGGYVNIPSKTIPDASLPQRLPGTQEDRHPLVAQHVGALRDALTRRERAERKLREAEKNAAQAPSPTTQDDTLSQHEVEKHRAEAETSFRRARLNQLAEDCSSDLQIVQACLERERLHFNSGMIKKGGFKAVESALIEIQRDTEEAHRTISRALIASVSIDIPKIEPELLKRLPHLPMAGGLFKDPDAWIAWSSALAWGLSVFLPMVQGSSLLSLFRDSAAAGHSLQYSTALPVLIGLIITVVALLPRPLWRGIGFSGLWTLFTLGGLWLLHATLSSPSMDAFHRSGPWYFRPAIDMMILGDIGLLAAAAFALITAKNARSVLAVSGILVAIGGILFASIPATPQSAPGIRVANFATTTPLPIAKPAPPAPAPMPPQPVETTPIAPVPPVTETPPKPASPDAGVIVQLRGVGIGDGSSPRRFMFRIQIPNTEDQNITVELGEPVFGDWKVTEYNTQRNTITFSNGDKLRILRVGEPQPLID